MSAELEAAPLIYGEADPAPPSPLLQQVRILGERPGGLVDAMVPVDLIYREDVPVDDTHVSELMASIQGESGKGTGTGQLSPVLLGDVAEHDQFLIVDGFHRDAALHRLGQSEIFSTIRTNSTVEEVLDLRILTANTHATVSFARISEWVFDAWAKSPWANTLSVVQAFTLMSNNSSGRNLRLSPDEVKDIRSWVKDKSDRWHMSTAGILINLTTAELSDPDLVKRARPRANGSQLEELTPQHLGVIARAFPKKYGFQRLIADIATSNNMTVPQTRAVVTKLKPVTDLEEARLIAADTQWGEIKPVFGPTKRRAIKNQQTGGYDAAAFSPEAIGIGEVGIGHGLMVSELILARLALANTVLRGNFVSLKPNERVFAGWDLSRTDDPDLAELTRPINPDEARGVLQDYMVRKGDAITGLLQRNHGLDEVSANALLTKVEARIIDDLLKGDLRFINNEDFSPITVHKIVGNVIGDELGNVSELGERLTAQISRNDAAEYTLNEVVKGLAIMPEQVRRSLVMSVFLGLSLQTTAALLDVNPVLLPHYLREAANTVNDTRDRKTARQFRQLFAVVSQSEEQGAENVS